MYGVNMECLFFEGGEVGGCGVEVEVGMFLYICMCAVYVGV